MGNYMPTFSSEEEFNAWNEKQSKKIPRDKNGIPTFKDEKHFCQVLESLGFSDVKTTKENINAIFKA